MLQQIFRYWREKSEPYVFLFVESGTALLQTETAQELSAGAVALLPPGTAFTAESPDGTLWLLRGELPDEALYAPLHAGGVLDGVTEIRGLLPLLAAAQKSTQPWREPVLRSGFVQVAALCAHKLRLLQDAEYRLASETVAYIREHYTQALSNAQIADALHYHPAYVNRVLQRQLGVTLHTYLVNCRVQAAQTLLRSTSLPVTDIARQVGCRTEKQLYEAMKRTCGCTPRDCREQKEAASNGAFETALHFAGSDALIR